MGLGGFDENVEEEKGGEREEGEGDEWVIVEIAKVEGKVVEKGAIGGLSFE